MNRSTSFAGSPFGAEGVSRPASDEQAAPAVAQLMAQAAGINAAGLRQMRDVGALHQALLQRELARVSARHGADSPRALALQAQLLANREAVAGLASAVETTQVRLASPGQDEAMLHGRVLDENRRGLSGLSVRLEDGSGQPLVETAVRTDAYGYYAFILPAAMAAELAKSGARWAVSVLDSKGNVVAHTVSQKAIDPETPGYMETRLNRRHLGKVRPGGEPGRGTRPGGEGGRWVVRGAVVDEQDNPVEGVQVSLFDRDRRYDDKLGAALTDPEGAFELAYTARDFRESAGELPDLYLTVKDSQGNTLYTSRGSVRFDASRQEVFHIRIARPKPGRRKRKRKGQQKEEKEDSEG